MTSQKSQVERTYVSKPLGALLRTERKYFTRQLYGVVLNQDSASWTYTSLDGATPNTMFYPVQGPALNQRIGRQVDVIKVQVRGIISAAGQQNQGDIDSNFNVRLIMFLDQLANGATVSPGLLMDTPEFANTALNHTMFQEESEFGRFRVLKDVNYRSQNINAVAATAAGNTVSQSGSDIYFHWTINFKKYPVRVRFQANAGTIADIMENAFHLCGHCTATAQDPTISYSARFVYVDA